MASFTDEGASPDVTSPDSAPDTPDVQIVEETEALLSEVVTLGSDIASLASELNRIKTNPNYESVSAQLEEASQNATGLHKVRDIYVWRYSAAEERSCTYP